MSMTLVNRLRNTALDRDNFPRMNSERWLPVALAVEAADEIDRLSRQLAEARAEVERLRHPWRAVDGMDWEYLFSTIGWGGRDRFWREVLTEMRAELAQSAAMRVTPSCGCVFCDVELEVHEDEAGFHHVGPDGERVPCNAQKPEMQTTDKP